MSRARQANDQAAAFIIACEDGPWSDAQQAELDAWLAESDGNKAAYWRLKHSWKEADRIGALGPGVENEATTATATSYRGPKWWVPASIAASLAVVIGIGFMTLVPSAHEEPVTVQASFQTPVGGRKMVNLADGSRIELNTASRVRAAVSDARREVWLERGEAYFEVAHNKERPFVVHAGSRQVTVLGTKFAVRRDGGKVVISVLEGRVRVDDAEDPRAVRSTDITGGDIALAQGAATLITARSEERVEDTLAWRQGMLSFDREPLASIAAEFNRYNQKRLVVTDAEVAGIRIGGIFPASKPAAFARLLREAYGLRVEETASEIRISN
ncbi:FecR domain-containing protein [Sphingomonas cannabina]|uniref:FecR family protein n=1 Tax=Sphingomonas cannabina TaxID=2899123 RepID=UPI001F16C06F|nr:FecR domain-containing protein [Sphingomonas cannabina]UIJ43508.1 FecR domain-containing protein [Sphingomonas cannabina]